MSNGPVLAPGVVRRLERRSARRPPRRIDALDRTIRRSGMLCLNRIIANRRIGVVAGISRRGLTDDEGPTSSKTVCRPGRFRID